MEFLIGLSNKLPAPLISFLNSQFVSSILGALLGAFAGAFAAHKIAVDRENRKELEVNIATTNMAIGASLLTCNNLLAAKRQYIEPICSTYFEDLARFERVTEKYDRGEPPGESTQFLKDYIGFNMPGVPFVNAENAIYKSSAFQGRIVGLVSATRNALDQLEAMIVFRQQLSEESRSSTIKQDDEVDVLNSLKIYFGLEVGGKTDLRYRSTMEGIANTIDDAIFLVSYSVRIWWLKGRSYERNILKNTIVISNALPRSILILRKHERYGLMKAHMTTG